MTYLEFKNKSKELYNTVDSLSVEINSFDWKNESVRMSSEFQLIKLQFDKEFKKLQDFNKYSKKEYKKQLTKEKRAHWRN